MVHLRVRMQVNIDRQTPTATWLSVNVQKDANQVISRALMQLGLQPTRFIRLKYGPFELGDLARAGLEEMDITEVTLEG
jgi:23S rRNA pseudouridine2605 synthase